MSVQPTTSDEDLPTIDDEAAADEDVEGHLMALTHPVAWELSKARQQEIARETARHSLIAEAKSKGRRKS